MRSKDERIAAVMGVVRLAERAAKDPGELVSRLVRTTGLSREGVLLGLREHLETDATEQDAARLVDATTEASRVHVILSSNVFVAALRAVAIAVAASPNVTVRPSSREPDFAAALGVVVTSEDMSEGEIHVYGRDETITQVRRSAREGVVVRGHGAGMGVAVITGDFSAAARSLAKDIVPFDQRGCLSPRVAFVVGDARSFADALFAELAAVDVPRGELSAEEKAQAEVYSSTVAYAGELLRAPSHAVGVSSSVIVPPPGRHLHVVALGSETEIAGVMAPLARHVVALGASDLARAGEWAPRHARVSALGRMQKPPLDGPVDRRSTAGV